MKGTLDPFAFIYVLSERTVYEAEGSLSLPANQLANLLAFFVSVTTSSTGTVTAE